MIISGTMNMVGVTSDAITSGAYKDIGSPFRAMRPDERELFQGIVEDMYERFVRVVVAGRPKLDEADVRRLADGRVYTASQALAEGLIDELATMREAVNVTKERAGASRIRLVTYHRPLDYRPNFYARTSPSLPLAGLLGLDPTSWLDHAAPRFLYIWAPGWR